MLNVSLSWFARDRPRERTCSRNEAGRRSETTLRRLNFQHGGVEVVFAPLRRRRHQHLATTGQGARLLRRHGRLQPLPGLRGRGALALPSRLTGASTRPRPPWPGAGWLVGPAGRPGLHGRRRRPRLRARRAAVSSWPGPRSARRPLRRPGRSDAGDLHRRRELEVVRRRRRRLVVNLHLAGRGGAAAGAGVVASADVEDDGPVSVA